MQHNRQRIFRLLVLILLVSIGQVSLAQVSATEVSGWRNSADDGTDTNTNVSFSLSMTLAGEDILRDTAFLGQDVAINALIMPEPEDVGAQADVIIVDLLPPTNLTMRNADGNFVSWNGSLRTLVPYLEDVTLEAELEAEVFSGQLGATGNHRIFVGFLVNAVLYFTPSALRFDIEVAPNQQTAREQAIELFENTISPTVVMARCIQCHIAGGQADNESLHRFVPASNPDNLDINFQEFEELHTATSTNYILSKVQGLQNHGGFQIFASGSTQYNNLQEFLELLDQTVSD